MLRKIFQQLARQKKKAALQVVEEKSKFVANKNTFLKINSERSTNLAEDQKLSVKVGDMLSGVLCGTKDGHYVLKNASLNGNSVQMEKIFMFKQHWNPL